MSTKSENDSFLKAATNHVVKSSKKQTKSKEDQIANWKKQRDTGKVTKQFKGNKVVGGSLT